VPRALIQTGSLLGDVKIVAYLVDPHGIVDCRPPYSLQN
jgi:hypothetical protein